MFISNTTKGRQAGVTGMHGDNGFIILSEIAFPPLGFVMTYNSPSPDNRLLEITHFTRYDYDYFDVYFLKTSILNTHMYLPGDYRTLDQIYKDYEANTSINTEDQG